MNFKKGINYILTDINNLKNTEKKMLNSLIFSNKKYLSCLIIVDSYNQKRRLERFLYDIAEENKDFTYKLEGSKISNTIKITLKNLNNSRYIYIVNEKPNMLLHTSFDVVCVFGDSGIIKAYKEAVELETLNTSCDYVGVIYKDIVNIIE